VPELPDVEGFRRLLERHETGRRIRDVEVLDDTVVRNTESAVRRTEVSKCENCVLDLSQRVEVS
jgi:formamidopyrimidine-DNA glycosylase